MAGNKWSRSEIEYLKLTFPLVGERPDSVKAAAVHLGRTENAVQLKLNRLGRKSRSFTDPELSVIRDWYGKWDGKEYTLKGLALRLDRSESTVCMAAAKLGLTIIDRPKPHIPGTIPDRWKSRIGRNAGRQRARNKFPDLGMCERCHTTPARDRHHADENTANNERSNVQLLCRRCHMVVDGRLDGLAIGRETAIRNRRKHGG